MSGAGGSRASPGSLIVLGWPVLNWANPAMILTFVWIVAIVAIVGGIAEIFQAFRQKRQ